MSFNKIEFKKINEILYEYKHKSGLKVYYVPKKGYSKKYATFSTHFGSVNNKFKSGDDKNNIEVPDGVAHFLEHKLFDQKYGNVMDKFSELGASPNAYTSFSQTVYLFSCMDKFFENFKLLLEFVQSPFLTDESIEREKGIIGQEIKMYEDDPNWRLFFNMLEGLYVNNPVKIDIAGDIDSISKIDKNILYKCYNTFYNLSNMVVLVVGDLDFKQIIEAVENGIKKDDKEIYIDRIFPEEPNNINKAYIEQNLSVSAPLFQFGFKENQFPRIGKDSLLYEMASSILLETIFGKSSKFYNDLYENGLIDNSFSYSYSVEENYAFSALSGESRSPEIIKDRLEKYINEIRKNGLNKIDIERTKNSYYGKLIKKLNSVEKISNLFISVYFRDVNMFNYYDLYDKITYNLISDIFKTHININGLVLSVIKPT